jgi:hypothetical protein
MPKRPPPQFKTIITGDGQKVTFMEHPEFDQPNSGSHHIELVPPFTFGDGLNGGPILLFSTKKVEIGSVVILHDNNGTPLHIVDWKRDEDFLEDIYIGTACIVSADPNVKIGTGAQSCMHSFSSTGLKLIP